MENDAKIDENIQNQSKSDEKTPISTEKSAPTSLGTEQNLAQRDPSKGYKINKTKFREALKGTGGIISAIAKNLSVSRNAVYNYIERNTELQQEVDDEAEKILDVAENKLFARIQKDEWEAVKFFLSRRGKKRGYTEKIEQETTNRDLDWERFQHILHDENADDVKDEDNKKPVG